MSSSHFPSTSALLALKKRRKRLLQMIEADGLVIIKNAGKCIRNGGIHYPFRGASHFLYLSSFPEPDSILVLAAGNKQGPYLIFTHNHDPHHEKWEGARTGPDGAVAHYGCDCAFPLDEFEDIFLKLASEHGHFYFPLQDADEFHLKLCSLISEAHKSTLSSAHETVIHDLDPILGELRLHKLSDEIQTLRKACQISSQGHHLLMQDCQPNMYEYQLQARFEAHCMHHGGRAQAYPPIVASGANACVLHYTDNNAPMNGNDLVLVDAGCELDGYASDITRTYPVCGRFSVAQRELYEIVLEAQKKAILKASVSCNWNDIHLTATRILTQGLIDLGLIKDSLEAALEQRSYLRFYMHRTGHWLGMDVHDTGDYQIEGAWRVLESGMVLTVEPGLYIDGGNDVPERYRNIGIRIEDDILIRPEGPEILSGSCIKSVDDIEHLMRAR